MRNFWPSINESDRNLTQAADYESSSAGRNMAGTWGMKTFQFSLRKLFMVAIAFSFAAGATVKAGSTSDERALARGNAHFVVRRAADFGTDIQLKIFIDGIQVTSLAINEGYEALVRPGPHVLSVATNPSFSDATKSALRRITMRPGQSYTFTALWVEADKASLENGLTGRRLTLWQEVR